MKTKSKRKLLFTLLITAVLLLGAAVLSACKIGKDEFGDYKKQYNLSGSVVYYANGGAFSTENSDITRKELYFPQDAPMLNISGGTKELPILRKNHTIKGWKIAVGGEKDGAPVIGEGDPDVEFPRKIGEGEHLVVYAVWEKDAALDYYLVAKGENFTLNDSEGNSYTTGGETPVYSSYETEGNSFFIYQKESELFGGKSIANATLVGFYDDKECTIPHAGNKMGKPADGTNGKIYVRYIAGSNWKILKTVSDVSGMFAEIRRDGAKGKKYLLYNDIDCGSYNGFGKGHLSTNVTFEGVIEGEGKTISNLKFGSEMRNESLDFATDYSLFGKIGSGAKICNLTFDTIALYYALKNPQPTETIAAIACGVESGATLTGFKIKNLGMTLQAPYGTELQNFDTETEGDKVKLKDAGKWIFGGVENEADAAVCSRTGVVLENERMSFKQP